MLPSLERAIAAYDAEVDELAAELVAAGVPPLQAIIQSAGIVQQRRQWRERSLLRALEFGVAGGAPAPAPSVLESEWPDVVKKDDSYCGG